MTIAESLGWFSSTLGMWTGKDLSLASEVIKVAVVDDHLNRQYCFCQGSIGFYIGYYQSQCQGEALHSLLFCLFGSGWQLVSNERVDLIAADGFARFVNRLVVERGLDRLTVLYWYQMFARVTASEYWRKLFLMHDVFFAGRTDVVLVRVIASIGSHATGSESSSLDLACSFVELVLPEVQQRLFRN